MAPSPTDRGQPTIFKPGRVINATNIAFTTPSVSWTIMNSVATVDSRTPLCQPTSPVCSETAVEQTLAALDITAFNMRAIAFHALRRLKRFEQPSAKLTSYLQNTRAKADNLYVQQWEGVWLSFPRVVLNCAGSSQCVSLSRVDNVQGLLRRSKELLRIVKQVNSRIAKARGRRTINDVKLERASQVFDKENRSLATSLPSEISQCS
jgi:hypothetical protein